MEGGAETPGPAGKVRELSSDRRAWTLGVGNCLSIGRVTCRGDLLGDTLSRQRCRLEAGSTCATGCACTGNDNEAKKADNGAYDPHTRLRWKMVYTNKHTRLDCARL